MMNKKVWIFVGKLVALFVSAAIVDIVFQYFTKPEIDFTRPPVFAIIAVAINLIFDWKKKKQ
jgi:multisubunit Na+/H+ antiporter MnhB subunit